MELQRLVLLDRVPGNAESGFVARALRQLRQGRSAVRAITSHASPMRVLDKAGRVIRRGHVGVVYSALSYLYCGRTRASNVLMLDNGYVPSGRGLSKIRQGESGCDGAMARLVDNGASRRRAGESGEAYLVRLRATGELRAVRNPGNYVYATGATPADTRALAHRMAYTRGPYPKADARRSMLPGTLEMDLC